MRPADSGETHFAAFPEEGAEEAGHHEEQRHAKGMDQGQGPIVNRRGVMVFIRPSTVARVADNRMEPDARSIIEARRLSSPW